MQMLLVRIYSVLSLTKVIKKSVTKFFIGDRYLYRVQWRFEIQR